MLSRQVHRTFARRMLPLAVLGGAVVAAAPPVAYRIVAWRQLAAQAAIYSTQMATGVQRVVELEPHLWRYNSAKVVSAISGHQGQHDIGGVTITACAGAQLFAPVVLGVGSGATDGPGGAAPVLLGSRVVARVLVSMDPSPQRAVLRWLGLAASGVGALLALALYFFPTRVVRRQAGELAAALSRQQDAERELRTINRELADRVARGVAEVRQLSERVVHLQEEERRRIARDLHDGVGQALTALQIELRLADGPQAAARAAHLAEAARLAEEILAEIRTAVFALRPAELAEMSLEQALRNCVERFELRTRVPAAFRVEGDLGKVPERCAVGLLRILQEALTNVSRHAAAGEVGVLLLVEGGQLQLRVNDDGRGSDGAPTTDDASGTRGMQERAAFLGGRLTISGGPGQGTQLEVSLPLAEQMHGRTDDPGADR